DCALWRHHASSFGPTLGLRQIRDLVGTVAADISVAVIRDRARRSCTARRREVVNNCAAGENFAGGRPAPARSQSQSPHPKRVIGRLLAEPEALAPTSHRKRPQEGHYISSMDGRAKRRKSQTVLPPKKRTQSFSVF